MIMPIRLAASVALLALAPAAHAQFLIDETTVVPRDQAAAPAADNTPIAPGAGSADEPAVPNQPSAPQPGGIGNQTIREVAERVVGRVVGRTVGHRRAAQVGQIEAASRDVLSNDPAGAGSAIGMETVLPVLGEVVKALADKKP